MNASSSRGRTGCDGASMDYPNARSHHSGGVNTLMADISARFIKDSIAMQNWWALGSRAGGEMVGADSD